MPKDRKVRLICSYKRNYSIFGFEHNIDDDVKEDFLDGFVDDGSYNPRNALENFYDAYCKIKRR